MCILPFTGMGSNFKTFGEAKLENLGSGDQADYYTTKASVVLIRKENCLYSACPSDGCNKKVVDMNNGLYRCEKCNREYDSFNWRLMLSVSFEDIFSCVYSVDMCVCVYIIYVYTIYFLLVVM